MQEWIGQEIMCVIIREVEIKHLENLLSTRIFECSLLQISIFAVFNGSIMNICQDTWNKLYLSQKEKKPQTLVTFANFFKLFFRVFFFFLHDGMIILELWTKQNKSLLNILIFEFWIWKPWLWILIRLLHKITNWEFL